MATRPLDAPEREQLCDLFLALGPDAPTLCEGWSTLDLAAHLVIREHDPRAGLAILSSSGRFAGLESRLMERAAAGGLDALVRRLRAGPPAVPWRLPGLRTTLNLNEWFVHHEDVRRANGQGPRTGLDDLDAALWKQLRRAGRFMVRNARGLGLTLVAKGFGEIVVRKGEAQATIAGPPQELMLFLNGRRDAAEVEVEGDEAALTALAAARLGI